MAGVPVRVLPVDPRPGRHRGLRRGRCGDAVLLSRRSM